MAEIRNILLIGRTGSGILSGTNDFKESTSSISTTKKIEKAFFEYQGIKYKVIDTVGIGDTGLATQEVLHRIADSYHEVKGGVNQILFVIKGKITEEELKTYRLLKLVVFDENISNHTTIVRTDFADFEDNDRCEEDRKKMSEENSQIGELVNLVNGVIHVDNPPLKGRSATTNKEIREESRKKILNYLIQEKGNYWPANLINLNERISTYMSEIDELKKLLEEERKMNNDKITELAAKSEKKISELEAKIEEQTKKSFSYFVKNNCKVS